MKLAKAIGNYIVALSLIFSMTAIPLLASSHAEAPLTSMDRFADNTDVYAFRSTEAGRSGFVTLIANFIPFQDPSGGPQFYRFDDTVLYEIKIDNTGDGLEDVTYKFQFTTQTLNSDTVLGHNAVNQDGVISNLSDPDYNMPQTYSVTRSSVRSFPGQFGSFFGRRFPPSESVVASGLRTPPSNVGPRVTPNYEQELGLPAIYSLSNGGKVFAGQRDEGFFIDVGGVFDVFALRSLSDTGGVDTLRTKNVSTIAIEVPIADLTRTGAVPASPTAADAVVGVWSTASRRSMVVINPDNTRTQQGNFQQISRLGSPLVNEVVVPLGLKDAFNALSPSLDYTVQPVVDAVLDPELPKLIEIALETYGPLGGPPVPNFNIPPAPRNDLAQIFVFGIPVNPITGPNFTTVIAGNDGRAHEMLRLNLAIAPNPSPSRLGILGGDLSGFPNGRRVTDDVVDIEIRAVLGGTPFTPAFNVPPNNSVGDGVSVNFEGFLSRFPYLQSPNQGNQPRPLDFPSTGTAP